MDAMGVRLSPIYAINRCSDNSTERMFTSKLHVDPAHVAQAEKDGCQQAVFVATETPGPMYEWCGRYLDAKPACTETRPEGIFSSFDGFPKKAMASSKCAYPSAPPMFPRFSSACRCFREMHPVTKA